MVLIDSVIAELVIELEELVVLYFECYSVVVAPLTVVEGLVVDEYLLAVLGTYVVVVEFVVIQEP